MQIKEILQSLRKRHNVTQEKIANYLGISKATYSRYETGTRKISIDTVFKIAEFYNINPAVIYDRNPDKKTSFKFASSGTYDAKNLNELINQIWDSALSSYEYAVGKDEADDESLLLLVIKVVYKRIKYDNPNITVSSYLDFLKHKILKK